MTSILSINITYMYGRNSTSTATMNPKKQTTLNYINIQMAYE